MPTPLRNTEYRTASYRRLVVRTLVGAFKSAFDGGYNRDRQFANLRITTEYPKSQQDYPCIVLEYQGQRVVNAGVGHEEWFDDLNGNIQKWHHNRFEGTVTAQAFATSTLDRDIFVDALVEVLRFGRLDAALLPFFETIYGEPDDPPTFNLTQLMVNVDEIYELPNNESIAPWAPEDDYLYSSGINFEIHGGYYNIEPDVTWTLVENVDVQPYPQGEQTVEITIPLVNDAPDLTPFGNTPGQITNPRQSYDEATISGTAVISSDEQQSVEAPRMSLAPSETLSPGT